MRRVKYIRTKHNEIIVFSELQQHSEFKHFNPVSAGFISIGIREDGEVKAVCYGESISLNLKSMEEDDTVLANYQLGFYY